MGPPFLDETVAVVRPKDVVGVMGACPVASPEMGLGRRPRPVVPGQVRVAVDLAPALPAPRGTPTETHPVLAGRATVPAAAGHVDVDQARPYLGPTTARRPTAVRQAPNGHVAAPDVRQTALATVGRTRPVAATRPSAVVLQDEVDAVAAFPAIPVETEEVAVGAAPPGVAQETGAVERPQAVVLARRHLAALVQAVAGLRTVIVAY